MLRLIIMGLALAQGACVGTAIPAAPAAIADSTALDEQGALGAELAYRASRTAAELAVDVGVLKGERATEVAALDRQAYAALQAVRGAYRTGNAASYEAALGEARTSVTAILMLIGR